MTDGDFGDDVVAAARAGDGSAFRVIYLALGPAVHGYLRGKGATDPEASTNDVFLALWTQLAKVDDAAGLRRLTFAIAHARLVDDLRQRRRRPVPVQFEPHLHDATAESAETLALKSSVDPDLIDSLQGLPAEQLEVLLLRVVADLSVEDVAVIMRKSQGAVRQLQHRALSTLRAIVAERRVTK